jgi:hypothetical protein
MPFGPQRNKSAVETLSATTWLCFYEKWATPAKRFHFWKNGFYSSESTDEWQKQVVAIVQVKTSGSFMCEQPNEGYVPREIVMRRTGRGA